MSVTLQPVRLRKTGWHNTEVEEAAFVEGDTPTQKELTLSTDILTNANTGKGVLDVLMSSVKNFLNEEYAAQRITGKEYSEVFLGALTAAMQTANQFISTSLQGDEIDAKIGLLRQQTVTELANTDDCIPVGLGFNYVADCIVRAMPVDSYENYFPYSAGDVEIPYLPDMPDIDIPNWKGFLESPPSIPTIDYDSWDIDDVPYVDGSDLCNYIAALNNCQYSDDDYDDNGYY